MKKYSRIISLFLIVFIICTFSITACSKNEKNENEKNTISIEKNDISQNNSIDDVGNVVETIDVSAEKGVDNVTYTEYDTRIGVLSGKGKTYSFSLQERNINKLIIEEGVTSIGESLFENNLALREIIFPSTLTEIDSYAFKGCTSLEKVKISDLSAWCNLDVSYESNPLYYAKNLYVNDNLVEHLVIPNGVKIIKPSTFYGCQSIKSVDIPSSVESIGKYAFQLCVNLSEINLSEGLKLIEENAFLYCDLKNIIIPNTVTTIGDLAFYCNEDIQEVYLPQSVEVIGDSVFDRTSKTTCTIYCETQDIINMFNDFKGKNLSVKIWEKE